VRGGHCRICWRSSISGVLPVHLRLDSILIMTSILSYAPTCSMGKLYFPLLLCIEMKYWYCVYLIGEKIPNSIQDLSSFVTGTSSAIGLKSNIPKYPCKTWRGLELQLHKRGVLHTETSYWAGYDFWCNILPTSASQCESVSCLETIGFLTRYEDNNLRDWTARKQPFSDLWRL